MARQQTSRRGSGVETGPRRVEHRTLVTTERRERIKAGVVLGATIRYRGGCSCGWPGTPREKRGAAEADAARHLEDAQSVPCGACGQPPRSHPRKGCHTWQFPGQLALALEVAS